LLPGSRPFELEPDPVPRDGPGGRVQRLDVLVGRVGGAEQHAIRLDPPHVPGFQVAEGDDEAVLHLLDGHELDESRDDGAGLGLAQVDGLDVEAVWCWGLVAEDGVEVERDKVERRASRWSVVAVAVVVVVEFDPSSCFASTSIPLLFNPIFTKKTMLQTISLPLICS